MSPLQALSVHKKILILNSYSQEYDWTKRQNNGFISTLQAKVPFPIEFSVEYLDTKRKSFDEAYEAFFVRYLQTKYDRYTPDVIYVTDDDALGFCVRHCDTLYPKTPVIFSGINNASLVATLDHRWVTGVLEDKEIQPNIELIRQFSPQTREIWIVGDGSTTYRSMLPRIRDQIRRYQKYTFHLVGSKKIDDVLRMLPKHKAFVILTTIGGFVDARGNNLTLRESMALLRRDPERIFISMEDGYVTQGVIGGYVTSGMRQGSQAALMTAAYFHGRPIATIGPLTKSPNIYLFDHAALVRHRLILSAYIARQSEILNHESTYVERHKQIIVDGLFIVFVSLAITVIVLSLILIEKNRTIAARDAKFAHDMETLTDLQAMQEVGERVLETGYWIRSAKEGSAVAISHGLAALLHREAAGPMTQTQWLESVHPTDLHEVRRAIEESTAGDEGAHVLDHAFVCDDGTVVHVRHTIARIRMEKGEEKVVGMVQKIDG